MQQYVDLFKSSALWIEEPQKYPVGTLMEKEFDNIIFCGCVQGHRLVEEVQVNWIVYSDGDTEELTNSELDVLNPQSAPASTASAAVQSNGAMRARASRKSHAEEVPSAIAPASTSSTVKPDPAPSSRVQEIMEDFDLDSKVKLEGKSVKLENDAVKNRIHEVTNKWIAANTDPATGKGRYVFKRGCQTQCITSILGGSGVWPWPKSKKDNEFIRPGEFYVAGNEAWNPYGPRFPGDPGLVNTEALEGNQHQREFHMFIQCSAQPLGRLWQGRLARGGRMVRVRIHCNSHCYYRHHFLTNSFAVCWCVQSSRWCR